MNALIALIPVTALALVIAVALFIWAVRHDQFRNLDTPEILPLLDDDDASPTTAPDTTAATGPHPRTETHP